MQVRIHQILATILSINGDSNKYIASKLAVIIQYISIQLFLSLLRHSDRD